MKKSIESTLCVILVLLMLPSVFAGCSKSENKESDANKTVSAVSAAENKSDKTSTAEATSQEKTTEPAAEVTSSNGLLTVKRPQSPDLKYIVGQYQDTVGGVKTYLGSKDYESSEFVMYRLEYYGNEGYYSDADTYIKYREDTLKEKYEDYTLFTQNVKINTSGFCVKPGSDSNSTYEAWLSGFFELDGHIFPFVFTQKKGVDDNTAKKFVTAILGDFTVNE